MEAAIPLGEEAGVGLGWGMADLGGVRVLTWTGGALTSGSFFLLVPDQHLAVGSEPRPRPAAVEWTQYSSRPDRTAWDHNVGAYVGSQGSIRMHA